MHFQRLDLRAFGCFVGRRQWFHEGFNLITGPNGAGKSTLAQAIFHGLFTSISTQKGMARFQPWGLAEGPAVGLMFKTDSGKEISVERDWGEGEGRVVIDGRPYRPSKRSWESFLQEEVGVSDKAAFAGTVFVAQDQLESSLWEPQRLAAAIERWALSGGKVRAGEILDRLDKEHKSLRRGMRAQVQNPGPIAALNSRLVEQQNQLDLHEANKQRYDDAQDQRKELEFRCAEQQRQRDALAAAVQGHERKREAWAERDRCKSQEVRLTDIVQQAEALDQKIQRVRSDRDAQIRRGLILAPRQIWGLVCFAVALMLIFLQALIPAGTAFHLLLAGLLILASLPLVFLPVRKQRRTPADTVPAAFQDQITHLEDMKESLLAGRSVGEYIRDTVELRKAREEIAMRLEDPALQAIPDMSPSEYAAKKESMAALTQQARATFAQLKSLEGQLSVLGESADIALRAREQKRTMEMERNRLLQRTRVYALTHAMISQARIQAIQGIMARLAPAISHELDFLTAGRYPGIRFHATLQWEVKEPMHHSGWVTPDTLSAGTRDQVNLAMRLGLVSLLFGNRKLPVFLDDPLVRFDAERRAAAGQTLQRLALDRQVFLFSHSPEYRDLADQVIELEPVTAGLLP